MTALAAGGSVLLLSVTAVMLWPRTYGTEATFVLDGGAPVANSVALAGRIEAALLEREQLAGAAMDLPPELRSPDPIGRLRAGIRVQSRGALGYAVEFRGSDPQSVQRIANRLADRAVALVPKLTAAPDDGVALRELAERSRAVSEFLTTHPEMTIDQASDKPAATPSTDRGLELLRTEKRQLEQKVAAGAADNPYADPGDNQNLLGRRLAELKTAIAKREAALKQPRPAAKAGAPELASKWRALLADLAAAQAKAAAPAASPPVTAHVTARAALPTSPLTPNRLVLSLVALLLSLAAALVAYILPRRVSSPAIRRDGRPPSDPPPPQQGRSDPPSPLAPGQNPRSEPSPAGSALVVRPRSDPPLALNAAPTTRSDPPPPGRSDPPPVRPSSEPAGPMAPHRPVVLTSTGSGRPEPAKRVRTPPGGLQAPTAAAATATHSRPPPAAHSRPPAATHSRPPPAAPLFGSRPPPGAGSYSVSSSHPPPFETGAGNSRTAVERLKPLQSAHPPAQLSSAEQYPSPPRAATQASASPPDAAAPTIMSRPPALDPEAERWAARFEAPPPAEEQPPQHKRAGRWKTQAMGSMVPLEVSVMREDRAPLSDGPASVEPSPPAPAQDRRIVPVAQPMPQAAFELIEHDVPSDWSPKIDAENATIASLRDAVLSQGLSQHLRIAVTGSAGDGKAELAAALALALAQAGTRVLLIEADFDHPQIHQALALEAPSGAGFSQQIMARRNTQRPRPWIVVRCSQNLRVLAEGRLRSPGLLGSEDFARALRELGGAHEVIVIHAPALDSDADLGPIDLLSQAAVIALSRQPVRIQFGSNPLRGAM
jgi:Mrp family chromosome partitioning ATPase